MLRHFEIHLKNRATVLEIYSRINC